MDDGGTVMRKVSRKGKVNIFEASDALPTIGMVCVDFVHALHR